MDNENYINCLNKNKFHDFSPNTILKKKKKERERILKWLVLSYILERTFNFLF